MKLPFALEKLDDEAYRTPDDNVMYRNVSYETIMYVAKKVIRARLEKKDAKSREYATQMGYPKGVAIKAVGHIMAYSKKDDVMVMGVKVRSAEDQCVDMVTVHVAVANKPLRVRFIEMRKLKTGIKASDDLSSEDVIEIMKSGYASDDLIILMHSEEGRIFRNKLPKARSMMPWNR